VRRVLRNTGVEKYATKNLELSLRHKQLSAVAAKPPFMSAQQGCETLSPQAALDILENQLARLLAATLPVC